MFAFAHLIASAEANGQKVINLSFDEYARYFEPTQGDLLCRYPPVKSFVSSNRLRSLLFIVNKIIVKLLRNLRFTNSFLHKVIVADLPEYQFNKSQFYDLKNMSLLRVKPVIFLFGRFFRDYDNVLIHKDKIKRYFTPVNEIQNQLNQLYAALRLRADILIGVHIRRGDYRQFVDGKYLFSQKQYAEKLVELQRSFGDKKILFILCSNESIDLSNFESLPIVAGPGHLVTDMYLLAKCDYIMGPPSTYTLWASFYGEKPLYQLRDLNRVINIDLFVHLNPSILYNFSFN